MHGVIFNELRKYATAKVGPRAFETLVKEAGLGSKTYLATQAYPDEEVVAIVGAASRSTGLAVPAILEDFGQFIAPDLLTMFKSLLRPDWRTLDVVENTEETIHKVVRLRFPDSAPPYLKAARVAGDRVVVTYTSPRKLCFIAKGIVRGIAEHFEEAIAIHETRCMHRGAAECVIEVSQVA